MNVQKLEIENTRTQLTRFNALRHGILSRYTVLPWEDENEYCALVEALVNEHNPQGPTEEHLVEELAGILWRKQRLRLAEAAAHQQGLENAAQPFRDTAKAALVHLNVAAQKDWVSESVHATPEQTIDDIRDLDGDEAMTANALKILDEGKKQSCEKAVAALRADSRKWWEETLEPVQEGFDEDGTPTTQSIDGLRRFIKKELLPWYEQRRKELENRHLIRAQAFGQSLDPNMLAGLARYEVHLDRKLEKMLSMLFRLKELGRKAVDG